MSAIDNNIIKVTNESFLVNISFAGGFVDKDTKFIRFGKRDVENLLCKYIVGKLKCN